MPNKAQRSGRWGPLDINTATIMARNNKKGENFQHKCHDRDGYRTSCSSALGALKSVDKWHLLALLRTYRGHGSHFMKHLLRCIIFVCFIAGVCYAQFDSHFVTQHAASAQPGGPGITVRQWNATGSNNQTTQFTLATISKLLTNLKPTGLCSRSVLENIA